MDITSATYLHPTPLPSPNSSSTSPSSPSNPQPRSLFSSHRNNISASILPAAAAAAASQLQPSHGHTAVIGDELQQSLQLLRQAVLAGLSERRARLASDASYVTWHMATKRGGGAAGASGAGDVDAVSDRAAPPTEHFQDLLRTSLDSVTSSLSLDPGSADPAHKAAALLAALDGVMLNVRFDMLQAYDRFPSHFATFSPGSGSVPAAEWMLAVREVFHQLHTSDTCLSIFSSACDLGWIHTGWAGFRLGWGKFTCSSQWSENLVMNILTS